MFFFLDCDYKIEDGWRTLWTLWCWRVMWDIWMSNKKQRGSLGTCNKFPYFLNLPLGLRLTSTLIYSVTLLPLHTLLNAKRIFTWDYFCPHVDISHCDGLPTIIMHNHVLWLSMKDYAENLDWWSPHYQRMSCSQSVCLYHNFDCVPAII